MSLLRSAFTRDSDSLNKHFAISHHSFSAISSAPPTFLNSKANLPVPVPVTLTLKAAKRTQNATGGVVKDNGIIVGLNPEAWSLEGWYLRYHGSR